MCMCVCVCVCVHMCTARVRVRVHVCMCMGTPVGVSAAVESLVAIGVSDVDRPTLLGARPRDTQQTRLGLVELQPGGILQPDAVGDDACELVGLGIVDEDAGPLGAHRLAARLQQRVVDRW